MTTRTRWSALALAATVLTGGATTASAAPTAVPSAAPTADAPPVCLAAGCRVVTRADVDGDGRRDRTSITPTTRGGRKAQVLRTVTARGEVAHVTVPTPWLYGESAWFGAAFLDGRPGAELVLRTGYGAHTQYFGVYGWERGRLAARQDPSTRSTQWSTDGALSVTKGYAVGRSGGAMTLAATEYHANDGWTAMVGTRSTFRWSKGAWRKAGTVTLRAGLNSPALAAAYGWHVKGLPVG